MNIRIVVLLTSLLNIISCGILLPHKANIHGIDSEGTVNFRAKNLEHFRKYYFSVGLSEFQRVTDDEADMLEQIQPLVEKKLKEHRLCLEGFEIINGSLRYYEGGLVSVELLCL